MNTSHFPGEDFPAVPSIELSYPDGWSPMVIQDTLMAIVRKGDPRAFTTNVCVTWSRFAGEQPLDAMITNLEGSFSALPNFDSVGAERTKVLSAPGYRMEGTFEVEGAGTVFQAVHFAVLRSGDWSDLVQAVGTCSAEQVDEALPEIREILESLTRS